MVRKIGSSKNRRWHQITPVLPWNCFIRSKKADNNGISLLLMCATHLYLPTKRTFKTKRKFKDLRADVCKYRPEACNKENIKILKKIHKVALGELLTEIYFLLRSDNCFRRTEVIFVSQLSDLAFRVSHSASRKAR